MDEFEIGMQTASHIPMWLQMAVAMAGGMVTALGGWEAIKYLLSLRANRRKDKAEAAQGEALAGQQDAELRQKELDLLNQIVETTKAQYGELKQRYDELLMERKADREEMDALRKEVAELKLQLAEQERKTAGLQRAFTESETKRLEAERYFCAIENCTKRRPPFGSYHSSGDGIGARPVTPEETRPDLVRDKKGRFTKKADEGRAEG